MARVAPTHIDIELADDALALANGDGLTHYDLHNNLVGWQVNTAQRIEGRLWRAWPNEPIESLKGLRAGTRAQPQPRPGVGPPARPQERRAPHRRDAAAARPPNTASRSTSATPTACRAGSEAALAKQPARDVGAGASDRSASNSAASATRSSRPRHSRSPSTQPWFVPASVLNALRRDAIAALEAARAAALQRPARAAAVEPPAPYPGDALTYLANVYNHAAHDFYVKHGVRIVDAAYESHQELGDVSLMITKHCVRWSLSLCPKQAKGVTGVQGTIRAEPLTMVSGGDTLTLRFDCKPCEMHVVGRIKRHVLNDTPAQPITFYRAPKAACRRESVPAHGRTPREAAGHAGPAVDAA